MKLTGETKVLVGILVATVALIIGAVIFFSTPEDALTKEELIPPGTITKGNPDASVWLVEFSDYQCPACKAAAPVVDSIMEQYGSEVLFAYRHFPLDQHLYAVQAAAAAEAAGAQGKYWEMHTKLFERQTELSDTVVSDIATTLGLDMAAFHAATASGAYAQKIATDRAYGESLGVNSTPTFYLNGTKLNLASFDDIRTQVETALGK